MNSPPFSISASKCFILAITEHLILRMVYFSAAVTGLHDMDEFVQSQLILAVSLSFLLDACDES